MAPEQLLHYADIGALWPADAQASLPTDMAQAYQTALAVRSLRVARSEVARGYKIGFTNRNIWPLYQVFAPIWGTVYDSTLSFCDGTAELSLARATQARLEPEAVFGMLSTPPANATLDELYRCIDWVAPGFEVVQSHAPNWKFTAAMTVADGGLHARLLVGKRVPVRAVASSAAEFNRVLSTSQVSLIKNGTQVDQGVGANVLDGPLLALHYFLNELRRCPGAPELLPNDVVTTGTWTDAWPIQAGETWQAEFASSQPQVLGALAVAFS